jgi:hypothetical protein
MTGGGTLLPMSDVIRQASHSHHYLVIFDGHTKEALYLGRTKRIATAGQRIVLHAKDRGCTHPGCTAPGYRCEVHHAVVDWGQGGQTNIDELTFGCGPHHKLVTEHGWKTRKLAAAGALRGVRPGQWRVARLPGRLPRRYPGERADSHCARPTPANAGLRHGHGWAPIAHRKSQYSLQSLSSHP